MVPFGSSGKRPASDVYLVFRREVRNPGRCPQPPALLTPGVAQGSSCCCAGWLPPPGSTGVAAALVSTRSATSEATGITGVTATEATLPAAGALGTVDLGVCVTQARADFIDLKLDYGALLAFFSFVRTALQTA